MSGVINFPNPDPAAVRSALLLACSVPGKVSITTRRGVTLVSDVELIDVGHASVDFGFSGRFAYGGIAEVDRVL